MADFNLRSDSVNVEHIMDQIRARIREKRGVDYTEQQIQELAAVKLESFLDPRGVRSDLLEQFRRARPPYQPPELPNYAFEEETLFESHRAPLRLMRRLFQPMLKLFFNPNPLIQALNIQARLNTLYAEREAKQEAARHAFDQLHYEVLHNLVVETTRLGIEVKNLKMRVESLTSRLEFNERRARALESVVAYRPSAADRVDHEPADDVPAEEPAPAHEAQAISQPGTPGAAPPGPEGPGQRSRRRRRRRGRRGGGSVATLMAAPTNTTAGPANDAPDGATHSSGEEAGAPGDALELDAPGEDDADANDREP